MILPNWDRGQCKDFSHCSDTAGLVTRYQPVKSKCQCIFASNFNNTKQIPHSFTYRLLSSKFLTVFIKDFYLIKCITTVCHAKVVSTLERRENCILNSLSGIHPLGNIPKYSLLFSYRAKINRNDILRPNNASKTFVNQTAYQETPNAIHAATYDICNKFLSNSDRQYSFSVPPCTYCLSAASRWFVVTAGINVPSCCNWGCCGINDIGKWSADVSLTIRRCFITECRCPAIPSTVPFHTYITTIPIKNAKQNSMLSMVATIYIQLFHSQQKFLNNMHDVYTVSTNKSSFFVITFVRLFQFLQFFACELH